MSYEMNIRITPAAGIAVSEGGDVQETPPTGPHPRPLHELAAETPGSRMFAPRAPDPLDQLGPRSPRPGAAEGPAPAPLEDLPGPRRE